MSLDILAVAGQVRQMGQDIANSQSDYRDRVRWARLMMQQNSQRWNAMAGDIRQSRETRTARAALPLEALVARHAAPPCPTAYVAAAADGSQAEPDRHGHVAYYLINTGAALMRYGDDAAASFHTVPRLFYRREDLFVVEERQPSWPATQEPREAQVDGEILAMKRSVAEVEDLARLAQNVPADLPSVLMIDGTLTLVAKSSAEDAWVGKQLVLQYRAALETIQDLGIPIVGFISRSSATWVMDMLQVGVCRGQVEACSFCRGRSTATQTAATQTAGGETTEEQSAGEHNRCALLGLRDRSLFDASLDESGVPPPLRPGERSALFQTSAKLFHEYGPNEPAMFYLNSGREVAQVQVPMWVARKPDVLDKVHALVYEQCVNGGGYPTVLARAHEQAIVTGADRETLDQLVLSQLIKLGIPVSVSEKARSKQVRGI